MAGYLDNGRTGPDFFLIKYSGAGEERWRRVVDGSLGATSFVAYTDSALAVAVDSQDHVVAVGYLEHPSTGQNFAVIKYTPGGAQQWQRRINGTAGASRALAVAIDPQDHVVAAGYVTNRGTGLDFAVVKMASTKGNDLFRKEVNGSALVSMDAAHQVAIDRDGDVIMVGETENSATGKDFTVAKFDGKNGREVWRRTVNGTGDSNDAARAVAVDSQNHILVAGNLGPYGSMTVIKYTSPGEELWRRDAVGTANYGDNAWAIALDSQDNVLVAGALYNIGTRRDFTVIKYTPDGQELWRRSVNGTGTPEADDVALAVAVDSQDHVVAAGYLVNAGTFTDLFVIKYTPGGDEEWRRVVNGPANYADSASAVAIDSQDNILVAGSLANRPDQFDWVLLKYSASGEELWRRAAAGTADSINAARAVAVDSEDAVLAAGYLTDIGTGQDFVVIKYTGDGEERWRRAANGTANGYDEASAVAVDAEDNIMAAGVLRNTGTGQDFAVIKYTSQGEEQWRHLVNGTANSNDAASAVAVDDGGNVVAVGYAQNIGTYSDAVVIKRAPDGSDY